MDRQGLREVFDMGSSERKKSGIPVYGQTLRLSNLQEVYTHKGGSVASQTGLGSIVQLALFEKSFEDEDEGTKSWHLLEVCFD